MLCIAHKIQKSNFTYCITEGGLPSFFGYTYFYTMFHILSIFSLNTGWQRISEL